MGIKHDGAEIQTSVTEATTVQIIQQTQCRKYMCSARRPPLNYPPDTLCEKREAIASAVYSGSPSKTPPGENQNLFATLTVRTYVWIVRNLAVVFRCTVASNITAR